MKHTTNWRPDPYGIHELRFFSADGKPTLLVMDGGTTSYDKPPDTRASALTDPTGPGLDEVAAGPDPSPVPRSQPPPLPTFPEDIRQEKIPDVLPDVQPMDPAVSAYAPESQNMQVNNQRSFEGAGPMTTVAVNDSESREPLSRPLKTAYGIVLSVLALSAVGLLVVHLHHAATISSSRGHVATTAKKSTLQTSPTTLPVPTTPKSNAEAAAVALVSSWTSGNRTAALTVATPAAVATLFTAPYTSGLAVDRGCSTAFVPIVCTFGPPGGASPSDPIYQILVSEVSAGWYVSSVRIEN